MEERKKQVEGSSFPYDIFGAKPSSSPPSSTGVFSSIFPPPPEVVGRRLSSDFVSAPQMKPSGNPAWPTKHGGPTTGTPVSGSCNPSFRDGSMFREERGEPCHLSSSLFYGGQDVCGQSSVNQAMGIYPTSKKHGRGGDDDEQNGNNSPEASRGNWWQGSLYY